MHFRTIHPIEILIKVRITEFVTLFFSGKSGGLEHSLSTEGSFMYILRLPKRLLRKQKISTQKLSETKKCFNHVKEQGFASLSVNFQPPPTHM